MATMLMVTTVVSAVRLLVAAMLAMLAVLAIREAREAPWVRLADFHPSLRRLRLAS
jgi:hypothetical protein